MTTFAFLDVETTGLSPKDNYILEIAWAITDKHFNLLRTPKTFIVEHSEDEAEVAQQIKDSAFIRNMHSKSGLLAELADPETKKLLMEDILNEFVLDLIALGRINDQVRFAGYSVSFDREFLRANGWGEIINEDSESPFHMHHRILDLSTPKQIYEAAEVGLPQTPPNENPHRAIDDALDALLVAQAFRDDVRSVQ